IEGIIALKKLECKDNGIRFIFNKNKSNDFITLKSIRQELKSAISHVINNSIEALNGKGNITFDLSLDGNLAKITISDDGPGVPQDKVSEIVKEGKSYNKKFGNGLGLPQCIETIESLGGEVSLKSDTEQGMTVSIHLIAEKTTKEKYDQEDISNFEYILIEDSKARRLQFEYCAKNEGVKVGTFSGYKELKEFLKKFKFNTDAIVITDSNLGEELEGEESAKELYYHYGFKDIRLLTAGDINELKSRNMAWISSIIGKHETQNFFESKA
ncbi:MAG: ATP-binding protein, partial [Bacteriovoracales bacterium]|nr:ATP-binding protein [Bacteriovoracales bacterium]